MAKRRKKSSGGHKRRVSGLKMGGDVELIIGAIGGAILTKFAKKVIPATLDTKIVAGVETLGGGAVATMFGKKSNFIKGLGIGIAAMGAVDLGTSFGLITGVGGMGKPIVFSAKPDGRHVTGYRDVPKVGNAVNSFPSPSTVGRRKVHMAGMYAGIYG